MKKTEFKILLVEDDVNMNPELAEVIEFEGFIVDTAKDGKEAIKKSNDRFHNLALIDIRLPDMEGVELLTKMKNTTPKMRKIIITGYPSMQNAINALNKGADAYIIKPFDMGDVLKTIKEQLKEQGEEKEYDQEKVTEFIETRVKELEEKTVPPKKPT